MVVADGVAAAQRGEADIAAAPRAGDAVAPALRHLVEAPAAPGSRGVAPSQRPTRRRVDLAAVSHDDDLDSPIRPEPRCGLLDQPQEQVDAEAGISRPNNRNA